jgi:hypothetical protein
MTASAEERTESARWIAGQVKDAARAQRTLYGMAKVVVDELDDLAAATLTPEDGHLLMAVALFIDRLGPELAKVDPRSKVAGTNARLLMMIGEIAYSRTANPQQDERDDKGAQ